MGGLSGTLARIARSAVDGVKGALTPESDASDERKIEGWITKTWDDIKTAYIIYHMSVWESFLFYVNYSWVAWDDSRKIFQPITPTDEWVPKPKINRFSPAVDAVASNFNQVPEVEATPRHDDLRSHGIADVASKLGHHFVDVNALRQDFRSQEDKAGLAAQLFTLAGAAFTRVFPIKKKTGERETQEEVDKFAMTCPVCDLYDEVPEGPAVCPNCGNPPPPIGSFQVEMVTRLQPQMNPDGTPNMEPVEEYEIKADIGNPLWAFPRPGSTAMGNTPYFLWAERVPVDTVKMEMGIDDVDPDSEMPDGYALTFEHALNYYYTGYSNATLQTKDSCMVIRACVEPGKLSEFPDGFYAVYINRKLKYWKKWSEEFIEHPYTLGGYTQIPTLFFPRSMAFDLVECQRELNSYESLIKLHGMTSAVEPIVIDENTVVTEITGRADKIIKWRSLGPGSNPPHRLQHGVLDDGIYKQRQSLHDEFENITGAVSVFRGQQPGSVTAASALSQLKGQAEQMFSKPTQNWNAMFRETVRKGVRNMQRFYTIAQIQEIVGPDRLIDIDNFKKCDLDDVVEWISQGFGQPRTRAERKKEMLELFDRGALDLTDVGVREKIFELWGDTGMMSQFNKDATRARWENKQMVQGQTPRFLPTIEDLNTHYAIHSEFVKSLEFEKIQPPAQQIIINHCNETFQALQMLKASQAQQPPPKGRAPQPKPKEEGAQP